MSLKIEIELDIKIAKGNFTRLKKILKSLSEIDLKWVGNGSYDKDIVSNFETLRYQVEVGDEGLVVQEFLGSKSGDDVKIWKALAPVVDDGSTLTISDDFGGEQNFDFKSGKLTPA